MIQNRLLPINWLQGYLLINKLIDYAKHGVQFYVNTRSFQPQRSDVLFVLSFYPLLLHVNAPCMFILI